MLIADTYIANSTWVHSFGSKWAVEPCPVLFTLLQWVLPERFSGHVWALTCMWAPYSQILYMPRVQTTVIWTFSWPRIAVTLLHCYCAIIDWRALLFLIPLSGWRIQQANGQYWVLVVTREVTLSWFLSYSEFECQHHVEGGTLSGEHGLHDSSWKGLAFYSLPRFELTNWMRNEIDLWRIVSADGKRPITCPW